MFCNKNSYMHNKGKDILRGPSQVLGEHSLSAEKMYSIKFTKVKPNFVWAWIIMEQTVTCLLMAQKFINLQPKILKLFQVICA